MLNNKLTEADLQAKTADLETQTRISEKSLAGNPWEERVVAKSDKYTLLFFSYCLIALVKLWV